MVEQRKMIDFNLEYLSKQLAHSQRVKALKGYHDWNIQNAVNLINMIYRKNQEYCLGVGFLRISVSRRAKVEKLLRVQRYVNQRYEDCFFKIRRYGVLSDKSRQIKQENKLNYPLAVLLRVHSANRVSKLQQCWERIVKYKKYMSILEIRLDEVQQFCQKYQKRMHMRELFAIFRRVLDRRNESFNHMLSFQKTFEILRVKKLFIALSEIAIKTEAKLIAELEKERAGKREEAVKANSRRSEQVNDLKRKTNNMKGQVNEETMRNTKKRTDGSRENGSKLMKKNEQLRGMEMGLSQAVSDIERMQRQLSRKQNFIKNRPQVAIPFQFMRGAYLEFSQNGANELSKGQVESKIGRGQLAGFASSPNSITADNIKLKHLINAYEQFESSKKSDSYLNLDNENSSLKGLIASIIRMQYFQPRRQKIIKNIDEINSNFGDLKLQMSQIRVEQLESRRR